jgi:STE24 endopeptidase
MYLPPVTLAQAQAVYAHLHISPAAIRLEHTYDSLYFVSVLGHLSARIAFLSLGLSALFRDKSEQVADRLMQWAIIRRIQSLGSRLAFLLSRSGMPVERLPGWFVRTPPGRWINKYIKLWQPKLGRTTFVFFVLYTVAFTALWFPLAYYESFVLPHRYGLSHQPFADWFGQFVKDSSIDMLVGALFASLIVWGIVVFPRRWATIFALWAVPIIFTGIFLDPLFGQIDNHFTKLPQSSLLYAPLHRLADKAGVPHAVILVADKSKQTDETNAYVTGLGSSAQIVLWDTTITRMPPDEIVAIIGHELGHYVEHHVIIGGTMGAVSLFLLIPIIRWIAEVLLAKFGNRWKISSLADPAAIPILIVSMSLVSFAIAPATNAISRAIEHRADSFGLAITGNRLAMARAMVDLANENLENPYPSKWSVFWFDDHPPTGERIKFALYGQPLDLKHEYRF